MQVSSIRADRWRNLTDVEIAVPTDAHLLCLVGENGTGKTALLELLAYGAYHCGLSPELPLKRLPYGDGRPHRVSVTYAVSDEISTLDLERATPSGHYARESASALSDWDGTLVFESSATLGADDSIPLSQWHGVSQTGDIVTRWRVLAGGVAQEPAFVLGGAAADLLRQRPEVYLSFIHADRVFPPVSIGDDEILALARQEHAAGWIRAQAAALTENMYAAWLRAVIGRQQREQQELYRLALDRRADGEQTVAVPTDPFEHYRAALTTVLPHLRFVRLDVDQRRLIFDAAGIEVPYEELSAGERELAFLVGQVERFGVTRGLFLLDEPELHLNAELLRRWLDYLHTSVESGQVWVATHALEAAEVAGPRGTLVLERDEQRRVSSVAPLGNRPALSTLAAQVGSPAFSLDRSRFVLIEGERARGERERFSRILGAAPSDRFLEAGSCTQVLARLVQLRELASAVEQLRIGAIVDRDFRTKTQIDATEASGAKVLPVEEVENLLLEPTALAAIVAQADMATTRPLDLLQRASDPHAGLWTWQRTAIREEWKAVPQRARGVARNWSWTAVAADPGSFATKLISAFEGLERGESLRRQQRLRNAVEDYAVIRADEDRLWRECLGKDTLRTLAPMVGSTDEVAYENRVIALWRTGAVERPTEVQEIRHYVESLPVASGP